jgi:uncharacterized protein YdeI (YjbR/CyaY-like superfamily)
VANVLYEDTVEEALCFGWIDSIVKRLDEKRYARKYTPRKPGSRWSEINKTRAEKMGAAGLMAAPGLALIDEAKSSGEWGQKRTRPQASMEEIPQELRNAFADSPDAERNFLRWLPPTEDTTSCGLRRQRDRRRGCDAHRKLSGNWSVESALG